MHINVKLTRQTLVNLEKITTIAVIFQGVSGQMLEGVNAVIVHGKAASPSSWLRMWWPSMSLSPVERTSLSCIKRGKLA